MTNTPNQPLKYTDEDIARYKRLHAPAHTADELRAFFDQCERTQLDPWSRQIYTVKRPAYINGQSVERAMTQVSIDGLRLQAERSGRYQGQNGPWWCGSDGKWVDVWVRPMGDLIAARVGVFRSGWSEPVWGVARFDAYAGTKKGGELNSMWAKLGDTMIAKCAEALALRKACPAELSGLYTTEEMLQADAPEKETTAKKGDTVSMTVPDDTAAKLKASIDANAAAAKVAEKAAAPKEEPTDLKAKNDAEGKPTLVPDFSDLKTEIEGWKTVEKANAGIPVMLSMSEPDKSAAMSIFKAHRIANRWEVGKIDGTLQVRKMNIQDWNSIERAEAGLVLIEAMEGDEKAEALAALEVKCFENKWKLTKSPKLTVRS